MSAAPSAGRSGRLLAGGAAALLAALAAAGLAAVGLANRWVGPHLPPRLLAAMQPLPQLGSISAATCRGCHPEQWAGWVDTGHGRATSDRLFLADQAHTGGDAAKLCAHCHAPLVEQQPRLVEGLWFPWPTLALRTSDNPRFDAALEHQGVTCVVCHQRDGAMEGPFTTQAPHPTRATPALRDPAMCEPCHRLDFRALGHLQRPLMETVDEWRAFRAAGGDRGCIDCHMPGLAAPRAAIGGPPRQVRDHRLRGPFDPELLRAAVEVRDVEWSERRVLLTLVNSTGHRLPTAEPHRRLEVLLEGLDETGVLLTDAQHVVHRPIDLERLEEAPGEDTTLGPREARRITLALPALPGLVDMRLEVRFVLWDPADPVAKAAGLDASALVQTLFEATPPLPGMAPAQGAPAAGP